MKDPAGSGAFERKEAAAGWFLRLRDGGGSARERASFEAWRSDPQNAEAYTAVEDAWTLAGAAAGHPEVLGLREQAARLPRRRLRQWHGAAAAALGAVALGAALWVTLGPRADVTPATAVPAAGPAAVSAGVYSTAVGERSTVTLADGSVIFLNTNSRVQVDYSADARRLVLERGQALFEVAKMADRPFVVTAGGRRVVALGTAFDVRLDADRLQVTLIEGRVSVESLTDSRDAPAGAELQAGQQLIATRTEGVEVRDAPVGRVTSWREGRLIFEDEPLARAVREMNRYSTTRIHLSDPALENLRVSGVFRTGQTQVFVEALVSYFPIGVSPASSGQSIVLVPEGTRTPPMR